MVPFLHPTTVHPPVLRKKRHRTEGYPTHDARKKPGPLCRGPGLLFVINDLVDGMHRQAIFPGQLFHRGALSVCLLDLPVPLLQFLPVAGNFTPPLGARLVCGDIEVPALQIALKLSDQPWGKHGLRVDVLHGGSLLEIRFKQQSQPWSRRFLLHANVAAHWLCMELHLVALHQDHPFFSLCLCSL